MSPETAVTPKFKRSGDEWMAYNDDVRVAVLGETKAAARASFEAALVFVLAPTLDEAWAEAEAALPEGAWLYLARTSKGRYGAQVRSHVRGGNRTGASGPTPAAALLALADRLRSTPASETEG